MKEKHATLFIPCIVDSVYPEVGEAVVRILKRMDVGMDYPDDQTCCGLPAFNSGYRNEAKVAAKRFIKIFEGSDVIVCPSGSCVHMVRNHYLELFKDDLKWMRRAQNLGARTFEFTEYLVDVIGVEDVGSTYRGKVTYHDTCSLLRGLGVKEQPRRLIRNIKEAEFVEMTDSDRCCGFGGTFSIKYSDISKAMLEEKIKNIIDSGAESVVGCDISCLMNIQGMLSRMGSPVKTLHIAQLLSM